MLNCTFLLAICSLRYNESKLSLKFKISYIFMTICSLSYKEFKLSLKIQISLSSILDMGPDQT